MTCIDATPTPPLFTPPTPAEVIDGQGEKGGGGGGGLDELRILNGKKSQRTNEPYLIGKIGFFTDVYANTVGDLRQWP